MTALAFDTETFLIHPRCMAPELVCVSWADAQDAGLFKHDGDGIDDPFETAENVIVEWIDRAPALVGHNVAFDLAVLGAKWPALLPAIFRAYDEDRIHDTMLRQKLRDIAYGEFRGRRLRDGSWEKITYHLGDLVRRHLGMTLAKGEDTFRLHYGQLHAVPLPDWPPDATGYSVRDSVTTLGVYDAQERDRFVDDEGGGLDLFVDHPRQARAAWAMQLMGAWGMPLAEGKIDALEAATIADRAELEELLIDYGLVRVDRYKRTGLERKRTRCPALAQARMVEVCDEMGVEPRATAKGGVCIDAEACEDSQDPVLEAYAQYSALGNVLGKDIKRMREGGGTRIHGSFDSLVASGRSACRGFNMQNMRVDGGTRECFEAPEGWTFCLIDLTAAELYAVAQICIRMFGHSRLATVLNAHEDPHVHLAAEITHRTYADLLAAVDAKDSVAINKRKVGKHANYGLWGGMREKRFVALVKKLTGGQRTKAGERIPPITLSPGEAHEIREAFLRTWPEAPQYLAHFERLCPRGARTTVVQEGSGRIRGGVSYSEACNTGFQGLIADLMKDALYRLTREMYVGDDVLRGSRVVNFPHDEIISLVPLDVAHDCAQEIQRIVLETGAEWMPDVPPIGEVYLAKYWSKRAFPVYGPDGRQVPWDGHEKGKAA